MEPGRGETGWGGGGGGGKRVFLKELFMMTEACFSKQSVMWI